ncbi:MAG: leucyl/phenylalanyl-tRNA--protein transferase [Ornithinimicrobium sp.]|jgi:leucyl/phenylalanyl-tRNA--protein transferase|uniref:leucyl/phenylalanyl-tRNA--protein transferase n=1 Tax=Ornithinimicrobium sp. TaxID=1977084 RepID=UPI003D9ADD3F
MPIQPPPTVWRMSAVGAADGEDLVGVGADLEPGTLLAAYRAGLFPMGVGSAGAAPMGWWSPDPRGVMLPGDLHVSRSLQRAQRHCEIRVDTAFEDVVRHCADASRPGAWITAPLRRAYGLLHQLGWAHSVETWRDGQLVGGLYGVAIGGLFAGESMFHHTRDASKVALVGLVEHLSTHSAGTGWAVDVQWQTGHLARMGVREVRRTAYLALVEQLVDGPSRWPEPRDTG